MYIRNFILLYLAFLSYVLTTGDITYCPTPYSPNDSDESLDYCKTLTLPEVPQGDDDRENLYENAVTFTSCCFLEYQLPSEVRGKSCLSLTAAEVSERNLAFENLLKIFPDATGTIVCKEDNDEIGKMEEKENEAKKESEGSKDNEGTVENFTKGDVVDEFWNAVEKLKDGEITSEPVKSTYGYHVIIRVSYTDKKALKDIKDELVDEMISAKLSEDSSLYTKTWVKIRNKYNLKLNDTTIKAKYEQTTNKSE